MEQQLFTVLKNPDSKWKLGAGVGFKLITT